MKRLQLDFAMLFCVLFATGLGAYLRIGQVLNLSLPLNDGGLFYSMTNDLVANGFHIPAFTTYNVNIPFAYPPLAFYLSGFLSVVSGWSILDILRILPSILSTLSIPAFFLLATDLLKSKPKTAIATLFFALIPVEWSIMGGGITRSLGFLFSLLTLWSAYRMYSQADKKYIFLTILFGSLACLSHPETSLHTVSSAIIFLLFFGRNKRGLVRSLIVVAGVLIFTAPWWVTVISYHGFSPFISATQTGGHKFDLILGFLQGTITSEAFLTFMGCFTVIGIFLEISKKDIFLPVWFFSMILSEPRSAPLYWTPIVAMLVAIVMVDFIFPGFRLIETGQNIPISKKSWAEELFSGRTTKIIFAFLIGYFIMSAYALVYDDTHSLIVRNGDLQAFEWIHTNIAPKQNFLVITGADPLTDSTSEWFPALTQENSIATIQGQEWGRGNGFYTFLITSGNLQLCIVQDNNCIESWKKENDMAFDYIYVRKWQIKTDSGEQYIDWPLQESLDTSGKYEVIFESTSSIIYKVN